MSIEVYHIETCQGQLCLSELPFLNSDEIDEFNKIGYTGKNSKGEKETYEHYLNSIEKGEFVVDQTMFDSGDFREKFTIARVASEDK